MGVQQRSFNKGYYTVMAQEFTEFFRSNNIEEVVSRADPMDAPFGHSTDTSQAQQLWQHAEDEAPARHTTKEGKQ